MASAPRVAIQHSAKGNMPTASYNEEISSVAYEEREESSALPPPPSRTSPLRVTAASQATSHPQGAMRISRTNQPSVGGSINKESKQQIGNAFLWTKVEVGILLAAVVIALFSSLAGIIMMSTYMDQNRITISKIVEQNNKIENLVNNFNEMKSSLERNQH